MSTGRTIRLHGYQAEQLETTLKKLSADYLVSSPTGSGKTTTATILARLEMDRKSTTHVIISAPQKQIEEGFKGCNGMVAAWPEGSKRNKPVEVPPDFVRRATGRGLIRQVLEYLGTPSPGYALACSHAALTALIRLQGAHSLPGDLSRCSLFVDEAHHAPAKGLSGAVAAWKANGGWLRFFTATPHRGDGQDVATPGMITISRTLAEQMLEGLAPKRLANELVPFGDRGDKVSVAEFTGEAVTGDERRLKKLAKVIVQKWLEDGRPKVIVRVPPMKGGCGPIVKLLDKGFRKAGADVVDSTGEGVGRQKAFHDILEGERSRSFAESQVDVIIGSQRVVEGTDWPLCSHVYCIGIPGSLNLAVQLLGRATRKKGSKHPSRDRMKIVFFFPNAGGELLDQLSLEHSRHALLVCVYLADHESGEELLAPKGNPFNPFEYAQVKLFMAVRATEEGATVGELVEVARKGMPDVDGVLLNYVAVRLLAKDAETPRPLGPDPADPEPRPGGGKDIFKANLQLGPEINEFAKGEFARIVEEFRSKTLKDLGSLKVLGRQLHVMTGGDSRKLAERFRGANGIPLTDEELAQLISEHRDRKGKFPSKISGKIPGTGLSWMAINNRLRDRNSSLPMFIASNFPDAPRYEDIDDATLVRIIADHQSRNGEFPTQKSGMIPGLGITWVAVQQRLSKRGSSLFRFITEHFTDASGREFSDAELVRLIAEHQDREGRFPPVNCSNKIPNTGVNWRTIDVRLRKRGSSLPQFIAEHFTEAPRSIKIDHELLVNLINDHIERTGEPPNRKSGKIPGMRGLTWKTVDSRLYGNQGLNLSRFISENIRLLPRFTEITECALREAITEWKLRTGEYPYSNSGEIPGMNGLKWSAVDGRLQKKNSSLARFTAEHFPDFPKSRRVRTKPKKKRPQSQPLLTVEV